MTLTNLLNAARSWYKFNKISRFYHNYHHVELVVNALYNFGTPSDSLLLAAVWHDAVYVPCAGSDANERCSAAALKHAAAIYTDSGTQEMVNDACDLIIQTAVVNHLSTVALDPNSDIAKLLDCDLYALSIPYDKFINNQTNIIKENYGTFEKDHIKCSEFLNQFLTCRPYIFHTDYGRMNWEDTARENITKFSRTA